MPLNTLRDRSRRPPNRGTQAVVLAVGGLADTAETVALHYALETLTLGGADDVDKVILGEEVNSNGIAEFVLAVETLELGQVALGGNAGFLEVTELGWVQCFSFCSSNPSWRAS